MKIPQLFIAALTVLFLCGTAAGQTTDAWGDPLPPEPQPDPAAEPGLDATAQPAPQPAPPPEEEPDTNGSLKEEKDTPYHLVGARFRWVFVPKWFVSMFGVDIQTANRPMVSNLGGGVEYTYRKNNFDITAAFWGVQLDWEEPIYFKAKNEPDRSWTEVTNGMSALLLTADFIWSSPIRDWVAITYGVGIGFGFPIGGDIVETEAYPDGDGYLRPCNGPYNPATSDGVDAYCEGDGEYGEVYDKLKIVPWINFLLGVRFKPHEHIAIYVDGGFGVGFQMGLRGGYIF